MKMTAAMATEKTTGDDPAKNTHPPAPRHTHAALPALARATLPNSFLPLLILS